MKYYILALKNYATFTGRTSVKEYWMFVLFNILFTIAAVILDILIGTDNFMGDNGLLQTIYSLFVLVPGLAAATRRLHDVGKSGWWLVRWHVIGGIVTLMFLAYVFVVAGVAIFAGDTEAVNAIGASAVPVVLLFVAYILAALIWLLILLVKRGTPGTNKYGPNPKEVVPEYVVE